MKTQPTPTLRTQFALRSVLLAICIASSHADATTDVSFGSMSATLVSYTAFALSLAAFGLDPEERRLVTWITRLVSTGRRNLNDAHPDLGPACP